MEHFDPSMSHAMSELSFDALILFARQFHHDFTMRMAILEVTSQLFTVRPLQDARSGSLAETELTLIYGTIGIIKSTSAVFQTGYKITLVL